MTECVSWIGLLLLLPMDVDSKFIIPPHRNLVLFSGFDPFLRRLIVSVVHAIAV